MSILNSLAFSDFNSATQQVLAYLSARLGFDLWMVTRTEGDDWIVLQAYDQGYGVTPGSVFRWSDSFCSQMVAGKGPRMAPDVGTIPAYTRAPIGQQITIGAYIGIPLTYPDGSLFGTLCAIHPNSQPETITTELPLIELLAGLLNTLLNTELKAVEQSRCAEQALVEAARDGLTGVYNRRGWDQLLSYEENRCQQYGHPACVIMIDFDGLKQVNDREGHAKGDQLICNGANAIQQAVNDRDIVARVGGDEFAVLCVECNATSGEQLVEQIQAALALAQVNASIGIATRQPSQTLRQAWEEADQVMYLAKKSRNRNPITQKSS